MAPDWLKMNRDKLGGWGNSLYHSPADKKLLKDKKRLQAMVKVMVSDRLADKPHFYSEMEQANALMRKIRLFLHMYLSLTTDLRSDMEVEALSILNDLNTERTQLQALSIWSVSNSTDAPAKWKSSQRRQGVSVMPWRAAVSYSEQAQFAFDHHWVSQYRYDKSIHDMARRYGGLAQLGAGLRNRDREIRIAAADQMGEWLKEVGSKGEDLFRAHARLAKKKRFNFAAIDASEKTLEIARRVALERAPQLTEKYLKSKAVQSKASGELIFWHDRYAGIDDSRETKAWRDTKQDVLRNLSSLGEEVNKAARRLVESNNLIQPRGRGGGFTTPVLYGRKGKVEAGPFVYAPFDGSAESERTLAHELGHAVHAYLSAPLGAMQSDAGWAVAETIALLFEHVNLSDDNNGISDQDFAMLVHQPAIAMFERELGIATQDMSADAVWIHALRAHYGPDISLKGYAPFWRRHSSSLSAPGYPMAYLLGWALAGYAAKRIESASDKMQRPMLRILKAGGNIGYDEAASLLGIRNISELIHGAFDRALDRLGSQSAYALPSIETDPDFNMEKLESRGR